MATGLTKVHPQVMQIEELATWLEGQWDLNSKFTRINNRSDAVDNELLEFKIEFAYSSTKSSPSSLMFIETFTDETYSNPDTWLSANPAEVMDDNDFNDNWKQHGSPSIDFKNGFIRPQKQSYMLEVIDEYNLEGVGQIAPSALSRYDTINECYWLISNTDVSNTIGEITKIAREMKDGKIQTLGKWYLEAPGVNRIWSGIDVGIGSGVDNKGVLYIILFGDGSSNSGMAGIEIRSDGSLGLKSLISGSTLDHSTTPDGTDTYSYSAWWNCDADYFANDVTIWDDDDVAIIACDNASDPSPTKLIMYGRGMSGGSFDANTNTDVTLLENYIAGNEMGNRSLIRNGNDLWIRLNDYASNYRFIFKIDITNDIVSNELIKVSGRFGVTRDTDSRAGSTYVSCEGISISAEGDILEVTSTPSNGDFISKRALKNALWAENQICGEYKMNASTNPNLPRALMEEFTGGEYYRWTADTNVGANAVDIYRFKISDGTSLHARLIGASWTCLYDLTYKSSTDEVYLMGFDGSNYEMYFGDLSNFVAAMATPYNIATTIDLTIWGTLASGIGAAHTNTKLSICYDVDDDIIYVLNDTDDKIDTLSVDGATYIEGVYDLPAPISVWIGIAYKNDLIYVQDFTNGADPDKIYVLDKNKSDGTAWYKVHMYQDPSWDFLERTNLDFKGNDLVSMHHNKLVFNEMKTLEDPDVMQLHTFMDDSNILKASVLSDSIKMGKRFFDPENFTDERDIPDLNYMVVGYAANTPDYLFSIFHLDEYLSGKSSTGKDRYDLRKIREQHFIHGGTGIGDSNVVAYHGAANLSCYSVEIDKDIIYAAHYNSSTGTIMYIIDLKSGKIKILNGTYTGFQYDGSISERNDGKGYSGALDEELLLSGTTAANYIVKIHARTFTKEDVSDYQGEYPKTCVMLGFGSSNNGGCDVLIIDWDENNNRTPVKVWNNVFTSAIMGHAVFIAPSGYAFCGAWQSPGGVWGSGTIDNKLEYIWDIQGDGVASGWSYNQIGSGILAGFVTDISHNSRCWKTASGEWRHHLLCSTYRTTVGSMRAVILDVENESIEDIWFGNINNNGVQAIDVFEDTIFFMQDATGLNTTRGLHIAERLRFDDHRNVYHQNNWGHLVHGFGTSYLGGMIDIYRPRFTQWNYNVSGQNRAIKYNKDFGLLALGSSFGLQFMHFSSMDGCVHESTILECNNPKEIVYHQSLSTPSVFKTETS